MKFISLKAEKGLYHITLNRADVRNAFNPEMIREIKRERHRLRMTAMLKTVKRRKDTDMLAEAEAELL